MAKLSAEELRQELVEVLNREGWSKMRDNDWTIAFLAERGWTLDDIKQHNEEGS